MSRFWHFTKISFALLFKKIPKIIALCILVATISLVYIAIDTHKDPIEDKLRREEANTAQKIVNDVTELNPVKVIDIVVPHTIEEIASAVMKNDHVSIGGGRNSMDGQTASERAVQIDMREYNKVLKFSTTTKEITVQSGIRWRDIQDYIDPYDLSVKIMQTYSNFTVGGSLSVNVHGRYIGLGPIVLSVKSFRIILADGSVVEASPTKNQDIFFSAIGGMGGIGVISDVTLELADNTNVERSRVKLPIDEYAKFFKEKVKADKGVLFHNGDIYPPDFDSVSAVSWTETNKKFTTEDRLIPRRGDYWIDRIAWVVMSEWPKGRFIRENFIDPILYSGKQPVHTRNYEASYDVAELEPESRDKSTYVLQEYFVPVEKFDEWIPKMKKVFNDHDVNVINVSIRHALPDIGAKLAWARTESFAFVVYYKQGTDQKSKDEVGVWTREMIDKVLSVGGTYYLPYQLLATDDQFIRAYPSAIEYFEIKDKFDPNNKFTNKLWDKYYSEEKIKYYKKRTSELSIASSTKDYFRPLDNTYLSLPEWYIVYSADEYANTLRDSLPSNFKYFNANTDYWNQYRAVKNVVGDNLSRNGDYITVLNVIGWSFSAENYIKGMYENTIGVLSEWCAGYTQVAEDKYASKVAKEYADFIYDYPWYDFPYLSKLIDLWTLKNDVDYTWKQDIRRFERKIFLSLEYGVKSIYSSLIAFATHSKFGVQDDIVYAIVSKDGGATGEIIGAPHYQPFTKRLIEVLDEQYDNESFKVIDISGNDRIVFTYRDKVGAIAIGGAEEILRDREVVNFTNGVPQYADRISVEVSVNDLASVYSNLKKANLKIDHFYDY